MMTQLEATLGTGGLAAVAFLGTLSFLAWWPAIAAVVVSERTLLLRLPLLLVLALVPPVSLAVMAYSIKQATPSSPRKASTAKHRRVARTTAPVREAVPIRARCREFGRMGRSA